MKIESPISNVPENEDKVFSFLTDFHNLESLVPKENLSSWEFHTDKCRLGIPGIGDIELRIVEKKPFKEIKLGSGQLSTYAFTMWIQLKQMSEKNTKVKITLEAKLNPILQIMAKKPLQQFVDTLADKIGAILFP